MRRNCRQFPFFLADIPVACDEFLSIHLHKNNSLITSHSVGGSTTNLSNYLPFGRWVYDKSLDKNKRGVKFYIVSIFLDG